MKWFFFLNWQVVQCSKLYFCSARRHQGTQRPFVHLSKHCGHMWRYFLYFWGWVVWHRRLHLPSSPWVQHEPILSGDVRTPQFSAHPAPPADFSRSAHSSPCLTQTSPIKLIKIWPEVWIACLPTRDECNQSEKFARFLFALLCYVLQCLAKYYSGSVSLRVCQWLLYKSTQHYKIFLDK